MALKLSECPPSLRAAILRQLEKEGRSFQQIPVPKYAVAHQMGGVWRVGPETENFKLIERQVAKLQTQSPRAAYMASKGTPTAVMIKLTRTNNPKE